MAKTGTVTKTSKNLSSNQFKYNNEKQLLTLCIKATLSDDGKRYVFSDTTTKKAKSTKTGKEYTYTEFTDEVGNTITIFKGSFDHATKVNSVKEANDTLLEENKALKASLATVIDLLKANGIELK